MNPRIGDPSITLAELLLSIFKADELRRFVLTVGGRTVADRLPTPPVSAEGLAHAAADELIRQGLIERCFEEALKARPSRMSDITATKNEVGRIAGIGRSGTDEADAHTLAKSAELDLQAELSSWRENCWRRFQELNQKDPDGCARYKYGNYAISYAVYPNRSRISSLRELQDVLAKLRGWTGWRPWLVFTKESLRPYANRGILECWINDDDSRDPAHSDLWRASRDGRMFLLRGF